MSKKGIPQKIETRYKISVARSDNRTKILENLKAYLLLCFDPEEKSIIPSIVSASLYAGISKKALIAWELSTAENSEVRIVLEFIRDLEEKFLREGGLLKLTDSKLTALLLDAEHGISPKPTSLTQNNNNFNVSAELLAEAIELSRTKKTKAIKP